MKKTFRFANYPCKVDSFVSVNLSFSVDQPELPEWAVQCLLAALLLWLIAFAACPALDCPDRASVRACVSSFQVVRRRLEGGPSERSLVGFWINRMKFSFCLS